MNYTVSMRDFLVFLGVILFGLAVAMMVLIIREVLPLLSPEDRRSFVLYGTRRGRRVSGQAIIDAWNAHSRSFPHSKKRFMVIWFVLAGIVAFLSYPLWYTFAK